MKVTFPETIDDSYARAGGASRRTRPGLVAVYSGGGPRSVALPLTDGAIELGREELARAGLADGRVSRRHLRVERDDDGRWTVRDLGSRNGTFVNGRPAQLARNLAAPVVRVGHTLLLAVSDVGPYESPGVVTRDGVVVGPAMGEFNQRVAAVAQSGAHLLILGGSGAGKELAAGVYHAATGAERPMVAVNCATIPHDLAERVLFGACRGAYTGAVADAPGLVQAADGATLFLDEVAELAPPVQAKLLRVLETKKVTPLGGVKPVPVSMRLCAATLKDLRAEVAAGRFREDLYFRIGRPEARLPALSERRDEIPWLVALALEGFSAPVGRVTAGVEMVEACMLRPWPGNVRELLAETVTAALAASARGRAVIAAGDLDDDAGRPLQRPDAGPEGDEPSESLPLDPRALEETLREEQGNVARAAARLGLSRSRVRRYIEREGVDLQALRTSASPAR